MDNWIHPGGAGVILTAGNPRPGADVITVSDGDESPESLTNRPTVRDLSQSFYVGTQANGYDSIRKTVQSASAVESTDRNDRESATEKKKTVQTDETIDDGDTCAICFESWSNAGPHRLSALRCGHVFGYSCITRWMETSNAVCPTCKDKIHKQDIRFIYAKKLIALDTMELENAKQQLHDCQTENTSLTMQIYNYRLKENQWLCRQKEMEVTIRQLIAASNPTTMPVPQLRNTVVVMQAVNRQYHFSREKSLEITKDGGCRSLTYNERVKTIMASAKRTDNLFPGYGIAYLDLNTTRVMAFQRLHSNEIRDIVYNSFNNLLASASVDQTFKIVDCNRMNGTVAGYKAESPLWSCCWDHNHPMYTYVGTQQGTVIHLDQRNMTVPISIFHVSEDYGAVASIRSLPSAPGNAAALGGVVICKLNSCWLFENTTNGFKKHQLFVPGPLFSMSVEEKTRQILVSSRARGGDNRLNQNIKHTLFYLDSMPYDNIASNVVHTYFGGYEQTKISRPCFNYINNELYVSAYHETDRKVYVWSVNTGQTAGYVPAPEHVNAVYGISNPYHSLITLSDKKMDFFKFV